MSWPDMNNNGTCLTKIILMHLQSKSLKLVLQTLKEVNAMVEAMTPSEKAELSADWLALLRSSTSADPWIHGFSIRKGEATGAAVREYDSIILRDGV